MNHKSGWVKQELNVIDKNDHRLYFAVAKQADKAVYITGGLVKGDGWFGGSWATSETAKVFDLIHEKWG